MYTGRFQNATKACWLALAFMTVTAVNTNAFVSVTRQLQHHSLHRRGSRLLTLKRMPDESEKAFFLRVTAAAADPVAFELLVVGDVRQELVSNGTSSTEAIDGIDGTDEPKRRRGYVRAEEWEAELQRKGKSGELSWEERVQFDGQQHGNRFAQNEILRRNLKLW